MTSDELGDGKYHRHEWECPEGCYVPLIDRIGASHRHECPNCGSNLVNANE